MHFELSRSIVMNIVPRRSNSDGPDVWVAGAHLRDSAGGTEVRALSADDQRRRPDPLDGWPEIHGPGGVRSNPCLPDALGVITPANAPVGLLTQTLHHPLLDRRVAQRRPQRPPVLARLGPGFKPGGHPLTIRSAPAPATDDPGAMSSITRAARRAGCRAAYT
jgi:hypothetical protein